MAEITGISWCDHTTNFWIGCTRVGPGCDNCYAELLDRNRFSHTLPKLVITRAGQPNTRERVIHWGAGAPRHERIENAAKDLRKWNRKAEAAGTRRRVFINSLSDFFDNEVPQSWRDFAYRVFVECEWLDILLVTKRPSNVMKMIPATWQLGFPVNVMVIATVVNQEEADRDIPHLLKIPGRRGLSMEPLLGPVELGLTRPIPYHLVTAPRRELEQPTERAWKIHWVIVGGESGHAARPMHPAWARSLRDQCAAARVPFHFKQHGEWASVSEVAGPGDHHQFPDGATVRRVGVKKAGRTMQGCEYLEFPK